MASHQDHIDQLLVRYLSLLNEYTTLRQELSRLQLSVYQNIARANFSAERGLRYGQNQYDERMQASRLLSIAADESEAPVFTMTDVPPIVIEEQEEGSKEAETSQEETEKSADNEQAKPKTAKPKNPLHWFGLLAPMPLRNAQSHSIEAVEQFIPKLVSVNAEMANLEIEVRRARKRRAKAETAQVKDLGSGGISIGEAQAAGSTVEAS